MASRNSKLNQDRGDAKPKENLTKFNASLNLEIELQKNWTFEHFENQKTNLN